MNDTGFDGPAAANDSGEGVMTAKVAGVTWLVLVAATIAGWLLSGSGGGEASPLALGIVAIACVKIYLVMAVFMGLNRSPRGWHLAGLAWIVVTGGLVYTLSGGGA